MAALIFYIFEIDLSAGLLIINLNNLEIIINEIVSYFILLPLLIGIFRFNNLTKPYRLLLLLVVTGTLTELIKDSIDLTNLHRFILNIYTVVETIILGLIFRYLLDSKKWKITALISIIVLCVFYFFNLLFIQGSEHLNSISMTAECIFVIVISTRLYNELIMNVPTKSLLIHSAFWFICGVFLYFSINFFTFLLSDTIYGKRNAQIYGIGLWHIHSIASIIANTCFAISLWLAGKKPINSAESKPGRDQSLLS